MFQAAGVIDEGWVRLLELVGAGLLGVVATVTVFRGTLKTIRGDVASITRVHDEHRTAAAKDLLAAETRLLGKIDELRSLITQRENTEIAETLRAEARLRDQFALMGKEMNERHRENRSDQRVLRRQQFTVLEILVDTLGSRVSKKQVDAVMKILRVEQERDAKVDEEERETA